MSRNVEQEIRQIRRILCQVIDKLELAEKRIVSLEHQDDTFEEVIIKTKEDVAKNKENITGVLDGTITPPQGQEQNNELDDDYEINVRLTRKKRES